MITPDQWKTIQTLVDGLDRANGCDDQEKLLRILKLSEEVGEVAQAVIGMTGQNPRKGVTHTLDDVQGELCDVIITAAVALTSITDGDPAAFLTAKLDRVAARAAAVDA